MKIDGRLSEGGVGDGVYGGMAILLPTKVTIEGGLDSNLDIICHTEIKLGSVLHMENASSKRK